MTQDRHSGAAAREWGLVTARAVGAALGAVSNLKKSNEHTLDGRLIVIKVAHAQTSLVRRARGGAGSRGRRGRRVETDDGSFEVWTLTVERCVAHAAAPGRPNRGVKVRRAVFQEIGRQVGVVRVACEQDRAKILGRFS